MSIRQPVFASIRTARGKGFTPAEVAEVDAILDKLGVAREAPLDDRRRINGAGLALIKNFEGLRLTPYFCPAGVLTVGYGSTGPHVKAGRSITGAEAEQLLLNDLERFERGVVDALGGAPASDGQFSAMVSLAFNVGLEAFRKSTLLKLHKAGDYAGAKAQFARWDKAGGKSLPGLTRRRAAEAHLYGSDA